jgi:hypothetical protein
MAYQNMPTLSDTKRQELVTFCESQRDRVIGGLESSTADVWQQIEMLDTVVKSQNRINFLLAVAP